MPKINQLDSLKVFQAVVECGSFTAAAKRLNISAARVSKSIEHLEAELETLLFNRSTRHMNITDSGEQCYNRALNLINQWQDLKEELVESQQSPKGKLRISAPMTWGLLILMPLLNEFMEIYPEISIDIQLADKHVNVLEDNFDLVLRTTHQLEDSTLICQKITSYPLINCATPHYLKTYGEPKHPSDLKDRATLMFNLPGEPFKWQFMDGNKNIDVFITPRLLANNSQLLHNALMADKGIALIPEFIIREDLACGKLTPILQNYTTKELNLYSLRAPNKTPSRRLRVLQDFLYLHIKGV